MKKHVFGRKLKRDSNQRKALFKGLISSFILHGKMQTTEAKAKSVKGTIDSLVTKVKKNNKEIAKRLIGKYVAHNAIEQFVSVVAPALTNRPGSYTRLIHLGRRTKDDAPQVLLEWVEEIKIKTLNPKTKKEEKEIKELASGEEKETKQRKPRAKKVTKEEKK